MGSIISPGIGSGLDINGLVEQLVVAEGAPKRLRLDRKEAGFQAELSALGTLRAALDTFRSTLEPLTDVASFQGRKVTVGDETIFTARADADSVAGQYQIEVVRLAQAHKLASAAFASADDIVGTGTLSITVAGTTMALDVADGENTLANIRDAINDADDNPGVLATIVTGVDGARLVLSASETGAANSVTVTAAGGDGGLDSLVFDPGGGTTNLVEIDAAQDAEILVDSFTVQSTTNTVSGAIDGVTLDLLAVPVSPGTSLTLKVELDRAAGTDAVDAFVAAYNDLVSEIAKLTAFDAESGVTGALLGDATLRSVASQIRREMGSVADGLSGQFTTLADIGITTAVDGSLELDATALQDALDLSFHDVAYLFAEEDGFATRLDTMLEGYLDTDGVLDSRTDGLKASIDDIGDEREALTRRLVSVEKRLRTQFNALDSLVGQLRSTSDFLAQQLANLPRPLTINRDSS